MSTENDELLPSEVRARILDEHATLRAKIAALRAALPRGEAARPLALGLFDDLEAHLALEDEILVPALRTIDAWGEERARRLQAEHGQQRVWLERNRARVQDAHPEHFERVMTAFLERLETDMELEEKEALRSDLLSEYPFPVDLGGG